MALQDINNNHMPAVEVAQVQSLMDQLEAIIHPYMRNLSEAENEKYGTINETMKLFVNKDRDYHLTQPQLQSSDVNWPEFDADFQSRFNYETFAMRMTALAGALTETRRTHDYDNYHNALIDYHYSQYKARTEPGIGYDAKVAELSQFFTGGGSSTVPDNDSAPAPTPTPTP